MRRKKLPPPASVQVYELTDWGYEAQPVFEVLGRWAARSPQHDPSLPISAISVMMSLRTMFDAGAWTASGAPEATVGFVFGEQAFRARIADGEVTSKRVADAAALADCDLVFTGAPVAVPQFVYGKRPLADMETEGSLTVTGDRTAAARFQTWFGLPEKAG